MEDLSCHYAPRELLPGILAALRLAGKKVDALTPDDLVPIDQFHVGGRPATIALAEQAAIATGARVLDVGGGFGGAARLLAGTRGCHVTVLDATGAYCRAGADLTRRLGQAALVRFVHGAAPALPFADQVFDLVWMQHCAMNVADKAALLGAAWRVLRPGGRLAMHEIMAGAAEGLHVPVPWAREASQSFLRRPDELRRMLASTGFHELAWRDESAASLDWYRRRGPGAAGGLPVFGLHVVLGPDFGAMVRNLVRNLEDAHVEIVMAVLERPARCG